MKRRTEVFVLPHQTHLSRILRSKLEVFSSRRKEEKGGSGESVGKENCERGNRKKTQKIEQKFGWAPNQFSYLSVFYNINKINSLGEKMPQTI